MNRIAILAAAFALSAGYALAQDAMDATIADFQAQGYTRIEAKHGPTQTKIEAIKGDVKVEVVIDNATGAVLKQETETVDAGENTAPGVFIRERDEDFVDGSSDDDDDSADDDSTDDGDDGDDDSSGDDSDDDDDNSGHGGGDDDSGHDDGDDD